MDWKGEEMKEEMIILRERRESCIQAQAALMFFFVLRKSPEHTF